MIEQSMQCALILRLQINVTVVSQILTLHRSMDYVGVVYCAFTVATVLVWHPLECPNRSGQWSPTAIADAMKLREHGTDLNFSINPLALHQGFHLFKKSIRNYDHELIPMRSRDVGMIPYSMDLPEVLHGWDIKFSIQKRIISSSTIFFDEAIGKKYKNIFTILSFRQMNQSYYNGIVPNLKILTADCCWSLASELPKSYE